MVINYILREDVESILSNLLKQNLFSRKRNLIIPYLFAVERCCKGLLMYFTSDRMRTKKNKIFPIFHTFHIDSPFMGLNNMVCYCFETIISN